MSMEQVAATAGKRSGPALSAHSLSKQFGDRVAFQDVSFEIGYGEVFGFLGPNGAGKTTTVRTLGTLIAPTAGSATVAGLPLTPENGEAIRQRIAIMPEAPGLYLRLTVVENLACFAGLYALPDARERIERALRAVNLAGRANDLCGKLSKGLRQRVSLARALLNDADVLFLDEPTSGLDPVAAREVHDLIAGLRQQGVTIFLTTHRLEEAERLCDRVALLNTTLRAIGRPDELREQLFAQTLAVRTLDPLRDPDRVFSGLPAVDVWQPGGSAAYLLIVSDPTVAAPAITRALVAAGADVLSIAESQHSLEDVYLELISEDVEAGTAMSASTTRMRAIVRKELREYRRNGYDRGHDGRHPAGHRRFPVDRGPRPARVGRERAPQRGSAGDPAWASLRSCRRFSPATRWLASASRARSSRCSRRPFGARSCCWPRPWRRSSRRWQSPTLLYALFLAATKLFAQPAVAAAVLQVPGRARSGALHAAPCLVLDLGRHRDSPRARAMSASPSSLAPSRVSLSSWWRTSSPST